jgi:crotonobetainyl-CoA:carnitine CoA-transferase CaiB-like acyl-CoA transferase
VNARVMHGVRVLDFSTNLPGPFGTQVLADLGADVIMVEGPGGEPARSKSMGLFYSGHRNRRSITIDLKTSEGVQTALRLAASCDIVVEGFRPGVLERLGVGYDAVRALRPDVIYCSITGNGQVGPRRGEAGHDINYLASSGALSFSGHWGDQPRRSGIPVVDLATSLYLTIAMLAALLGVERSGEGAYIDLSMADVAMTLASPRAGTRLENVGGQEHMWPNNDLFETSDGEVLAVGAIEEHLWQNLRTVLATVDPAVTDPRFDTEPSRREHGDDLHALLHSVFEQRTASEWQDLLKGVDTAVTRVISIDEASRDETARLRRLVQEIDGVRHVMLPFQWNAEQPAVLTNAGPAQGEHTDQIMAELHQLEASAPASDEHEG